MATRDEIVSLIMDAREKTRRAEQERAMRELPNFNPNEIDMCGCMGPPPKVETVDGRRLSGVQRCRCVIRAVQNDVDALIAAGLISTASSGEHES